MISFVKIVPFWVDDLGWPDVSLGVHICWKGRIDFHFLKWIISIGKVPIYNVGKKRCACSNSFHEHYMKKVRRGEIGPPLRTGAFP